MTQSSTDSSLVERLLGYAESGFATDHKTDCATAAYELVALAADRDAALEFYLTLQQSNAVLASHISTLECELEESKALNNKYAWERDKAREERDATERRSEAFWKPRLTAAEAKVALSRAAA